MYFPTTPKGHEKRSDTLNKSGSEEVMANSYSTRNKLGLPDRYSLILSTWLLGKDLMSFY